MLIVHVFVHVKPDCVEAFKAASLENARHSVQEPGIARFDVIQQVDDPTRFVLVEIYPHRRCSGSAQGNGSLRRLARYGGRPDGGTPEQREIRQSVSE